MYVRCRTRLHPPRRAPPESGGGQRRATLERMYVPHGTYCMRAHLRSSSGPRMRRATVRARAWRRRDEQRAGAERSCLCTSSFCPDAGDAGAIHDIIGELDVTKNTCVSPNCVRAYASFPLPLAYTATSHALIVDAPTQWRGVHSYGAGSCVCGGRSRMGPMCFFTRRQHQSSASPRRGMEARTTFRRARTSPRMAASASSLQLTGGAPTSRTPCTYVNLGSSSISM